MFVGEIKKVDPDVGEMGRADKAVGVVMEEAHGRVNGGKALLQVRLGER